MKDTDTAQPGIRRRTLIKRAAATGAVVWTAPLIIDSLTSPAAAVSCAGTCFRVQIAPNALCSRITQTETVSTIAPCGTLTAAACTTTTNVAAGAATDRSAGGVCTDVPDDQFDCLRGGVRFNLDASNFCTWGGGGTCNPRRFLAAQASTNAACVPGFISPITIFGFQRVFFARPAGQQWEHFQFIIGCSCA